MQITISAKSQEKSQALVYSTWLFLDIFSVVQLLWEPACLKIMARRGGKQQNSSSNKEGGEELHGPCEQPAEKSMEKWMGGSKAPFH